LRLAFKHACNVLTDNSRRNFDGASDALASRIPAPQEIKKAAEPENP
jgi:hypothetical protein